MIRFPNVFSPERREEIEEDNEKDNEKEQRVKEIEEELQGIREELERIRQINRKGEQSPDNITIEELRERVEKGKQLVKQAEELKKERDKLLGIEVWEELEFKEIPDYFKKEYREKIKNEDIFAISAHKDYVFAGRREGYFTLYQRNPETNKMEIVKIPKQEELLPGSILESRMTDDYLAVSGWPNHLKVYSIKNKQPQEWFKDKSILVDLSDKFQGPVSGLDISPEGLVGGSSWEEDDNKPKVCIFDIKNKKETLEREYPEVGNIYTFLFLSDKTHAVLAGDEAVAIIDYQNNGEIVWEYKLCIKKCISLSSDKGELIFTKRDKTDKICFLDVSNPSSLEKNQPVVCKQVLDKEGNPFTLEDTWRLSLTPDNRHIVIGSYENNHLYIINRQTVTVEKEYEFEGEAVAVDPKGNVIAANYSKKQLGYID